MGSAALKVQGGKLLKARVETSGGRIASLKLTGDFFLHPEETLAEIETALTNHQLNESAITATISSLLQKKQRPAHRCGARGLRKSDYGGFEMNWRVIPLETCNAATAMALDEACGEYVKAGGPQTIRFWRWKPSAVSIGCFQSLEEEVDLAACKRLGVDFVRRRTGGGAVYHDYEGEITYSITAPEHFFGKDITASYKLICGWLVDAFAQLGIAAEFKPINDIITGGKKISGNAQTRRGGVLLQHGTILYDVNVRKMFSVLRVSKEKISDKMIAAAEERVTSVKKMSPATYEQTYDALVAAFTKGKETGIGKWTDAELLRAKELAETKYKTKEWNFQR